MGSRLVQTGSMRVYSAWFYVQQTGSDWFYEGLFSLVLWDADWLRLVLLPCDWAERVSCNRLNPTELPCTQRRERGEREDRERSCSYLLLGRNMDSLMKTEPESRMYQQLPRSSGLERERDRSSGLERERDRSSGLER